MGLGRLKQTADYKLNGTNAKMDKRTLKALEEETRTLTSMIEEVATAEERLSDARTRLAEAEDAARTMKGKNFLEANIENVDELASKIAGNQLKIDVYSARIGPNEDLVCTLKEKVMARSKGEFVPLVERRIIEEINWVKDTYVRAMGGILREPYGDPRNILALNDLIMRRQQMTRTALIEYDEIAANIGFVRQRCGALPSHGLIFVSDESANLICKLSDFTKSKSPSKS